MRVMTTIICHPPCLDLLHVFCYTLNSWPHELHLLTCSVPCTISTIFSLYHYMWTSIRALCQAAGQSSVPAGNRPSASHVSSAGVPTHAEPGRHHTHSHLFSQQHHYPQGSASMMPSSHVQSHSTHRAGDTDCNLDIETDFLIFPTSHIILHSPGSHFSPVLTHDHLLFISVWGWCIYSLHINKITYMRLLVFYPRRFLPSISFTMKTAA